MFDASQYVYVFQHIANYWMESLTGENVCSVRLLKHKDSFLAGSSTSQKKAGGVEFIQEPG
jgi:hypothetical protein